MKLIFAISNKEIFCLKTQFVVGSVFCALEKDLYFYSYSGLEDFVMEVSEILSLKSHLTK